MNYSIVIFESVFVEVEIAVDYYEYRTEGLGEKVYADFWNSVNSLQKIPLAFRIQHKQFRQIKLNKFPYYIVYEVNEDAILINRFFHAKRDSKTKYKK